MLGMRLLETIRPEVVTGKLLHVDVDNRLAHNKTGEITPMAIGSNQGVHIMVLDERVQLI